jgi:hypothetical protein
MLRELEFLRERAQEHFVYVTQKGWTAEKLHVLFMLNSVYQLCIGPLHASARVSAGLGGKIPIQHGADLFNRRRAHVVNTMALDFVAMVNKLGFQREWMSKNTCGDLIYWIARHERELESGQET